jgi:hypothetical protein
LAWNFVTYVKTLVVQTLTSYASFCLNGNEVVIELSIIVTNCTIILTIYEVQPQYNASILQLWLNGSWKLMKTMFYHYYWQCIKFFIQSSGFPFGVGHRSLANNLRIWQEIIWHCCQNDRLFQNKWPKRPTHATYSSDSWSSILQFVHNLFWLKLKWNARSKLFYCIIYRFSMLWWSSRTLTKLKLQSQKRFNERKYKIFEI